MDSDDETIKEWLISSVVRKHFKPNLNIPKNKAEDCATYISKFVSDAPIDSELIPKIQSGIDQLIEFFNTQVYSDDAIKKNLQESILEGQFNPIPTPEECMRMALGVNKIRELRYDLCQALEAVKTEIGGIETNDEIGNFLKTHMPQAQASINLKESQTAATTHSHDQISPPYQEKIGLGVRKKSNRSKKNKNLTPIPTVENAAADFEALTISAEATSSSPVFSYSTSTHSNFHTKPNKKPQESGFQAAATCSTLSYPTTEKKQAPAVRKKEPASKKPAKCRQKRYQEEDPRVTTVPRFFQSTPNTIEFSNSLTLNASSEEESEQANYSAYSAGRPS